MILIKCWRRRSTLGSPIAHGVQAAQKTSAAAAILESRCERYTRSSCARGRRYEDRTRQRKNACWNAANMLAFGCEYARPGKETYQACYYLPWNRPVPEEVQQSR